MTSADPRTESIDADLASILALGCPRCQNSRQCRCSLLDTLKINNTNHAV
jgi:hypothetical protein